MTSLSEALAISSGLYTDSTPVFKSSVMIVSCNFAVMDILMNWACHANRLGLKFLLIAMDKQLADVANEAYFKSQIPYVYQGDPLTWKNGAKKIDANVHNAFRNGQFNTVSLYKLASVRDAISMKYNVLFSDIDIVLLHDPIPALFPPSVISDFGVVQPLPDFSYQQNIGGWWGDDWKKHKKDEGNTGMYFMQHSKQVLAFLDSAIERSWKHTNLDDQTNLFDELQAWKKGDKVVSCLNKEDKARPVHGFEWPRDGRPGSRDDVLYICPLPRLPFATGYGHRAPLKWKEALSDNHIDPILLHFNSLGRGGGHDFKRQVIEEMQLWHWQDKDKTCNPNGNLELKERVPITKP